MCKKCIRISTDPVPNLNSHFLSIVVPYYAQYAYFCWHHLGTFSRISGILQTVMIAQFSICHYKKSN